MVTRRVAGVWAGLLVGALALGACTSDPGPTDAEIAASEAAEERFEACAALATDITEAVQEFVDGFAPIDDGVGPGAAGASPGPDTADAPITSVQDLQDAAETFGRRRAALGCGPREFEVLLSRAVEELEGRGPLARAVVAQVRDELLPTIGPSETVDVAPGDDLIAAVHGADPDALIRLAPGRHELDEPLLLLRPTRLVGAGSDRTTIVSDAPNAVLLQAGGGPLRLEGMTVAHEGDEPASVVVVAQGGYDLRDVVVRGGVADVAAGSGWGLVLGVPGQPDAPEVRQLTDVRATGNGAGGVAVGADRAPNVDGLEADDNQGCGVCFSDAAAGRFTGLALHGNEIGLVLAGDSAPNMADIEISDNTEAGIVVEAASSATVSDARVTANGAVGVVLRGTSTVQLTGLTIGDHVEVGLLVEGAAAPVVADVEVAGSPVGILARGESTPQVDAAVVSDVVDAHLVWGEQAAGRVADATCQDDTPGLVLLDAADPELGDDVCAVIDQRDG